MESPPLKFFEEGEFWSKLYSAYLTRGPERSDGDCLFFAVSYLLGLQGRSMDINTLREFTALEISTHWSIYEKPFIQYQWSAQQVYEEISKPHNWRSEIFDSVLGALAEVIQLPIVVYSNEVGYDGEPTITEINYTSTNNCEPLYLAYVHRSHYIALVHETKQ
jgi:hypothetical protein